MITNANPAVVLPGVLNQMTAELYGLSSDTKPADNVPNGSVFLEIDTGKIYIFNGADGQWTEFGG